MKDLALLIMRLVVGPLVAGHGAQKLFGWFGGRGLEATGERFELLGLSPGREWALVGGLGEFAGGLMTALGLLSPLGPISIISSMSMASIKVHKGKPIWTSQGGAELPAVYMAAGIALGIAEPGRFSLDRLFGIKTPRSWIVLAATTATALVTIGASNGLQLKPEAEPEEAEQAEAESVLV
jgi:putative oxidoreductase